MIVYRSILLYQTKISAVMDRGRLKVLEVTGVRSMSRFGFLVIIQTGEKNTI